MQDGSDPLGVSAEKGHIQTIKSLLDGGANINYQDKVRSTCHTTGMHHMHVTSYYKTPS